MQVFRITHKGDLYSTLHPIWFLLILRFLNTTAFHPRDGRGPRPKGALATALGLVFREAPAAAAERLLVDLVAAYVGEEGPGPQSVLVFGPLS